MLDKIVKLIGSVKEKYADARVIDGEFTNITIKDSQKEVVSNRRFGIGIRVFDNGSWGFASCNSVRDLESAFKKANALAALGKGRKKLGENKSTRAKVRGRFKIDPRNVSLEDKINDSVGIEKNLKRDGVTNTTLSYTDSIYEKTFISSEGSEITQEVSSIYLSLSAIAKRGSNIQTGRDRIGKMAGYEALDNALQLANETGERAVKLLDAKLPPKGRLTTIMDGKLVGVLSHEATGHACEADGILANNSVLEGKLGSRIANEMVSISDSPHMEEGFGYYEYDDEGIKSSKTRLITNGILTSYLHSRETANDLEHHATGNARAGNYDNVPIVRMSNTYFERGDFNEDEIFEGVKLGVYARGMRGGQVIPKLGSFVFAAEDGWLIENGEKTAYLRDILLNGSILETLNLIDAVGRDFTHSPGMCGKMGQSVPVSDGGPHVRVKEILIGGQ